MKYTSRGQGNLFDGGDMIIKKIRERYITQSQLSEAVGISKPALCEIIHGHRRPSKAELSRIATELDINMNEWRSESNYVRTVFPVLGNRF